MNEWFAHGIGWLIGTPELSEVHRGNLSTSAGWTEGQWSRVLVAAAAVCAISLWLYRRRFVNRPGLGWGFGAVRGLTFALLVVLLAEPILELQFTERVDPTLWLLVDGSDSMNLVDEAVESDLNQVVPPPATASQSSLPAESRFARVRASLLSQNVISGLQREFEVQAFMFDRPDAVSRLTASDRERLATEYNATGRVTAIGAALQDLRRRHPVQDLAGVLIVSDFVQTTGPPAVPEAVRLNVPVYAVGVGPLAAADIRVEIDAEPTVQKSERSTITAILHQSGLDRRTVAVRLRRGAEDAAETTDELLQEQTVELTGERTVVEFPVVPDEAGRFRYSVSAEPLFEESVVENNSASRTVTVTDDYLRLLFVEYEPTWEWRFVKEVFHRDELVGMRGFRTYLRSSDPAVRQSNELFLSVFPPLRDEFFQYDVIVLGDMPATALPFRFFDMTREFVSQFGGGLVVLAGPRFGPQELARTPLADMLPVIVDPDAKRRDSPFEPVRTAAAERFDFMRLGDTPEENMKAWNNLGTLPWYHPVRRIESTATVLVEHPLDTLDDAQTKQPLIVRRPYGAAGGEVVYLGTNEFWRLRRQYGEKYYRQFWAQLIHRLGLGHVRGGDKRFVVDPLPEAPFQPEQEVPIVVRGWNRNFERLTEEDLPQRTLAATLFPPRGEPTNLTIPMSRAGVFETRPTFLEPGNYRLQVTDPITDESAEVRWSIADVFAERRVATRNDALQTALAAVHPGGKALELADLPEFIRNLKAERRQRTHSEIVTLWDTWLMFLPVVGLLLVEWAGRKWAGLP